MSGVGERRLTFDIDKEEREFKRTFEILRRSTGENTFRAVHHETGNPTGFRSLYFETITLGIQELVPHIDSNSEVDMRRLEKVLQDAKQKTEFRRLTTGGGKNFLRELRKRINFIRSEVRKEFNDILPMSYSKTGSAKRGVKSG